MRIFILALVAFLSISASQAQVIQINPNIEWKFIRSQDLTLQNNSVYQYEFPGEKGYDYIFTMVYDEKDFVSFLKVFDLQNKPIAAQVDSFSKDNTQLQFRVPQNGTYSIVLGYSGSPEKMATLFTKFSLIRRPRVD
ncbi:MAG: hypothetical protein RLZZ337_834 [Bacteroidota bacterium]|jgi:hypothetical protein